MMAGAMLGAAAARRVVIVDGFIAGAVALVAAGDGARRPQRLRLRAPLGRSTAMPRSSTHLGAAPLLDLGMRLGEGTGALLAWPLVRAAAAMLTEMASFESAGVSGPA